MQSPPDSNLTLADKLVWEHLKQQQVQHNGRDSRPSPPTAEHDHDNDDAAGLAEDADDIDTKTVRALRSMNDPASAMFQPTVVTGWDDGDMPDWLLSAIVRPYATWAATVVRRPTDVVFLTHILLYLSTSVPSALWLFRSFGYTHATVHLLFSLWYCGPFTLMLHNHIHNGGVLASPYKSIDRLWPVLLCPLMGHTWNSYYYHHVKHHHVENNGPNDLSSTLRFQRDSLRDFACYVGRFIALIWLELPLYFYRRRKYSLAVQAAASELGAYVFVLAASVYAFRAALFTLILPLALMRLGLMVGNWGQHAFVDELEPDSDYRSSITLIDVNSNRHCFNDGYHTSHHLNPRRHWRDHPLSFIKGQPAYALQHALVFQNIDFVMITVRLLRKDYDYLARCLIPIGEQVGMSLDEIARMLRSKTRRFTEDEIRAKFPEAKRSHAAAVARKTHVS